LCGQTADFVVEEHNLLWICTITADAEEESAASFIFSNGWSYFEGFVCFHC
jgi:hypothetical protein